MAIDCTRREFLGSTAVAAGAAPGSNDRIGFASIGVGNRGTEHLRVLLKRGAEENVRVTAVCDVFQRYLNRAVSLSHTEGYLDYRRVLERKDVDAVVIATPDHWHARIALDALAAGKHVYLEKPMTLTIEGALAVRNAVRRTGLALQVGPQWTADDAFWKAQAAIRRGSIGKVTWAQSGLGRNFRECLFNAPPFRIDPSVGPQSAGDAYVDWDMWLGHRFGLAPKIPFNPEHFFRFRKYWAYSGGLATDLLYHRLAPMLLAIAGPNGEYPQRVQCAGGLYVEKDGRDIPDTILYTIDYPSEFSVFLVSTLTNSTQVPTRIYGKHGTMEIERVGELTHGGDPVLTANGEFEQEFKLANDGYGAVRLVSDVRRDMLGNFIDAIRGKGALYCNAELGAATMVAIRMGIDAWRQRKVMTWDAANERVI